MILVITSDIPLRFRSDCQRRTSTGARVVSYFTAENIGERLNIRDFMDTMRSSGIQSGGPPPLNQADRQRFANHLDKILQRL